MIVSGKSSYTKSFPAEKKKSRMRGTGEMKLTTKRQRIVDSMWMTRGGFQKPMEYWIGALTFTPDGSTMISGSRDCTIKFWDMPNLEERRTLKGHSEWVRNLIVTQDGKVLISASDDGTVKMWDIENGRQFRTIKSHKGPVRGIALSTDGKYLATAGNDRIITLWEGGE